MPPSNNLSGRRRLGLPGVRIRIGYRPPVATGGFLMLEHVTRCVFGSMDMLISKAAASVAALQSAVGGGGDAWQTAWAKSPF